MTAGRTGGVKRYYCDVISDCCHANALTLLCVLFGVFWLSVAAIMFVLYSHHLYYRGQPVENRHLIVTSLRGADEQELVTSRVLDEQDLIVTSLQRALDQELVTSRVLDEQHLQRSSMFITFA